MMPAQGVTVSNSGEKKMLDLVTADRANWKVRLYKEHRFINGTEVVADFTEANYPGYVAQDCPAFGAAATIASGIHEGRAEAVAEDELTFTRLETGLTGPQDIYGYFVTHETHNIVLFAEAFQDDDANADPQTLTTAGESLIITLRMQLFTEGS